MDFDLTEEQRAIKETARAFARGAMMPFARQWDEDEVFPADTLREAAALGLGGIYVAADVGGSALSRLDAVLIFEELAQGCPSTAAYLSIHNMVAWMIDAYGSSELRQRFLPDLCSMAKFGSYCLTEPDSGSDAASLKTRAQRRHDHYVLDGTKAFISGGGRSDVYLVMARTGEWGPPGISCFLVGNGRGARSARGRRHAARGHGQAAGHRYLLRRGQRLPATPRGLRLSARPSDRAGLARSARPPDSRRHQRGDAAHRQSGPAGQLTAASDG